MFRVTTDFNHYQTFATAEDSEYQGLMTTGSSLINAWTAPKVIGSDSKLPCGDFWSFHANTLILSSQAAHALQAILSPAGEILPLPFEGEIYALVNVTNVLDGLDSLRSVTWPYVKNYVFDPHILSQSPSPLLKIPQTCRSEVLLVEGLLDPALEFRAIVERNALQGAVFDLLWEEPD